MVEQTFIKGKDACLEASISRMQAGLQQAGFEIEEASWLNPVPNVYSVHIRDAICPALFTNGKGASRKATLASALGEYFERVQTNYFFADFWLGNPKKRDWLYYPNEKSFAIDDFRKCLTPELWDIYDADKEWQGEDLLSLNDDAELIRALPLVCEATQQTVYFPMSLFSNIYASNGLCAGNTALEAKVQGLSEIFERWVKNKILLENICLPEVPESLIQTLPMVVVARDKLQALGIAVSIRDASLGGLYPVLNVTLFDQAAGTCFASFGAHPIFEVALERTLTESLQGRSLDQLEGFQLPVFDAELVAEDENIENHFIDSSGLLHAHFLSNNADYQFEAWNFEASTDQQWGFLVEKVQALGFEVFTADYDFYGMPAARVIVPGMSEIYPMDELLNRNQNMGRTLRDLLTELSESDLSAEDFEFAYEEIDYLGLSDHQGVANLVGLLSDDASPWKTFKVIDLKLALALSFADADFVSELLETARYYLNDPELGRKYHALGFILNARASDIADEIDDSVFNNLFGKELVDQIMSHIDGDAYLWGMDFGPAMFEQSVKHQTLLKVYERVNQAKAAAAE